MNCWETKIRQWEQDLKEAGDPRLSSEGLTKYEATFAELESLDLPVEVISDSKLPDLIDSIKFTFVSSPGQFPFKPRAIALAKKWRRLEAAASSAALSNLFPPGDRPPIPIPSDVLMHILESYVGGASMTDDPKERRRKLDYILDCALVAKDWSVVAMHLLYRGPITLDSVESIKLLLRTVENELETPCPIRQLRLTQGGRNQHSSKEFVKYATLLISRCTEIRYLNFDSLQLSFSPEVSIPMLHNLTELKLEYESLRLVAPLFHKLPNLRILRILGIQVYAARIVILGNPIPAAESLEDIPPPTFMLKELHISQTGLVLKQCQWLFSSSTAIDYVELQDIYDHGDCLASSIGPHVKALHMNGMTGVLHGLAAAISKFTALTSLRVSSHDWSWVTLLNDIRPSLEEFAIPYSRPGCEKVAQALSNTFWQPHLRSLTVYHRTDTDYFYGTIPDDIRDAKSSLETACVLRKVSLKWITEGN